MPKRNLKFSNYLSYHVYNRGVSKIKIFDNTCDLNRFVRKTKYYSVKFNIKVHSYAVMKNHYHLLISGENIPIFLQSLQQSHSNYFNHKYQHKGCVFESRYKAKNASKVDYFIEIQRYIKKNPIDTKFVKSEFGVAGTTTAGLTERP